MSCNVLNIPFFDISDISYEWKITEDRYKRDSEYFLVCYKFKTFTNTFEEKILHKQINELYLCLRLLCLCFNNWAAQNTKLKYVKIFLSKFVGNTIKARSNMPHYLIFCLVFLTDKLENVWIRSDCFIHSWKYTFEYETTRAL